MKTLEKHKTTILALIVFLAIIFVYKSFFKVNSTVSTESANAQNIGTDLVDMYNNLEKVALDQTLFSSPGYRALSDFSVALLPQPVGRSNPFDILGR